MNVVWKLSVVLGVAAWCGGCFVTASTCGEGTTLQDGECVPVASNSSGAVQCGEGTELRNETCEVVAGGAVQCGEGTELRNGTCEVTESVLCGEGTTLQDGVCVADLAVVECGPGTHREDGQCVPGVTGCSLTGAGTLQAPTLLSSAATCGDIALSFGVAATSEAFFEVDLEQGARAVLNITPDVLGEVHCVDMYTLPLTAPMASDFFYDADVAQGRVASGVWGAVLGQVSGGIAHTASVSGRFLIRVRNRATSGLNYSGLLTVTSP